MPSSTLSVSALREAKARQSSKIRCLSETLIAAGFLTLDAQAKVLGLARSTAWTIFRSTHKGSGLSAATINRMLRSPGLPLAVRAKLIEYVEEKASGAYGHSKTHLRKFCAQIAKHTFYESQRQTRMRPSEYPFLQEGSFGPEEVSRMVEAYEIALCKLRLIDRSAPVSKLVASKILELARTGELDPAVICAKALEGLDT